MCPTISETTTIYIKYYGKDEVDATPESLSKLFYDQGVIKTGTHKSKYHWEDVSWSIKINLKGDTIATV